MQKYEAIENGIANNDVKALREAIGSICYTNRNFSNGEFFEAIEYVESKGIQLKDAELVGKPTISSQKDEFTDEDFARAVFELKKNFCDARIDDVKIIGEKLYGKNSTDEQSEASEIGMQEQKVSSIDKETGTSPNQQSHQLNKKIAMAIGVVAIIVIIVIITLVNK